MDEKGRRKAIPSAGGLLAAVALLASQAELRSAVTVTATEAGGAVVFVASGTIDTAAWSEFSAGFIVENIEPSNPTLVMGTAGPDIWSAFGSPLNYSAPASFGAGGGTDASSGAGDVFGIIDAAGPALLLPGGYASGSALAATMTFDNTTFASLGVSPGRYVWSWGDGPSADSLTLDVVPEPAAGGLVALGLGAAAFRRRRR